MLNEMTEVIPGFGHILEATVITITPITKQDFTQKTILQNLICISLNFTGYKLLLAEKIYRPWKFGKIHQKVKKRQKLARIWTCNHLLTK